MASKEKTSNFSEVVRQSLTKEMITEVEETYKMAIDTSGVLPVAKLPLALKALGMGIEDIGDKGSKLEEEGVIDLDRFMAIVVDCVKASKWAANEMNETFSLFDKDGNGYVSPPELRRVFLKIGEGLSEQQLEDQLREHDIDGDYQMVTAEYYKMVCYTKGTDFQFEDSHF